jgi:hypothetical protein
VLPLASADARFAPVHVDDVERGLGWLGRRLRRAPADAEKLPV